MKENIKYITVRFRFSSFKLLTRHDFLFKQELHAIDTVCIVNIIQTNIHCIHLQE